MTAASTITMDGMTYGCDENGNVMWAVYTPPKPEKPAPALPAEVYSVTPFDAERAHQATLMACRGQR